MAFPIPERLTDSRLNLNSNAIQHTDVNPNDISKCNLYTVNLVSNIRESPKPYTDSHT